MYSSSYEQAVGVSASILAPDLNINWSGINGFDSKEKKDSLIENQTFRIASITKTFVAVAILKLHEESMLSIDDPISKYISVAHIEKLIEGGYNPDSILIRQCLNHTSGLFDYAMGSDVYQELVLNDPEKVWTRTEQLELAMQIGKPVGKPGARYHYSDTGYILLGEIIEILHGADLGVSLRQIISYEKLNLESTYLESIEPNVDSSANPIHCYFKRKDVTDYHPSLDLYGGGGLVSSTKDLANFFNQLFNSKVFENQSTLDLMLEKSESKAVENPIGNKRYKDYRLGVWKTEMYGKEIFVHRGLWNVGAFHIPEDNITMVVKSTTGKIDRTVKKLLHYILEYEKSKA